MEKQKYYGCGICGIGKSCFKLFGVDIILDEQKQAHHPQSIKRRTAISNSKSLEETYLQDDVGSLSERQIHSKRCKVGHERKKAKVWTEEEHKMFLAGMKMLGKGSWTEISRRFVTSKTPAQVASHAQKYFLKQASNEKSCCKSSVVDIPFEESTTARPQDSPQNEISSQASASSSATPLNNSSESPTQAASISDQILNGFSNPCSNPIIPVAENRIIPTYLILNPCMPPARTGSLQYLPVVQATNNQRPGYVYMPKNLGNFIIAPVVHSSGIALPNSVQLQHTKSGTSP